MRLIKYHQFYGTYLFIYLFSTDREDKEWQKNAGSWDKHYIEEPFNINRTLPKLYISSCILNSQCVQPLHLLMIDLCDKYSNSSSTFFFKS